MTDEERLRKVIERTLQEQPHYKHLPASDIATDLIPALLDELDDVFEKAWQYDQLCE